MDHEHRLTVHIGLTAETIALVKFVLEKLSGDLKQEDKDALATVQGRSADLATRLQTLANKT